MEAKALPAVYALILAILGAWFSLPQDGHNFGV